MAAALVLVVAAVQCECSPLLLGGWCLVACCVAAVSLCLSGLLASPLAWPAAWGLLMFVRRMAMAVWLLGWLLRVSCFVLVAAGLGGVVGLLIVLGFALAAALGLVIPGCLW